MNEADFNEWLGSLNHTVPMPDSDIIENPLANEEAPTVSEPEPTALSVNDFADILADNGFVETSGESEESEELEEPEEMEEPEESIEEDVQIAVSSVNAEDSQDTSILLPKNSPTLLRDDSTSRFSGTEWYEEIKKAKVILAGCGGIGSNVAFQLARMTPASIFLYDPDRVETVNMSGQLYAFDDVGRYKVDAIASMINGYTTMQSVYALRDRFTEESEAGDIMICGFDNMAARRTFFEAWRKHMDYMIEEEKKKCLFIDGRLSIDTLQVFCIQGDNIDAQERYEENYLFSDEEADETICSMKQTTYLASMIGSIIVNLFTNFIAGLLDPVIPYDLPFFTQYEAQFMLFKTEN